MIRRRRNLTLYWLAVAIFSFVGFVSRAQLNQTPGLGAPESAPFVCRTWRSEDGLPQESVWAVTQTRDGFLWIGTGGGLARFDGFHFQVFGMAEGLPSLYVRALLEDRHGNLWIGTAIGLCRYSAGKFTSWTARDGLAGDNIAHLAEDGEGSIWIGSDRGLTRWRDGKFEIINPSQGMSDVMVRAIMTDRRGSIWLSLVSHGLMRWEDGKFVRPKAAAEIQTHRPYDLLEDRAGNIWVSSVGKILCFTETSHKSFGADEGLPGVLMTCLAETKDGTIWCGTSDQGLYYLRKGRFHPVRQSDGLSDEAVRAVIEDSEGNLWVGTRGGGLNRLQPRKVTTRKVLDGATEVQPLSLAESGDGVVWAGTIGHGLYRMDGERQQTFLRDEMLPMNFQVYAVLSARDGSLWCAAGQTLFHWNGSQLNPVEENMQVRSLCETRDGGLWLGTYNGALHFLRDGKLATFTNGVPAAPLTALVQSPDGTLWIGSYGGGLSRFKDGQVTVIGEQEGLSSALIQTLFLDSQGTLWIGTEGAGLGRLKEGRVVSFTKLHGLVDDTIVQILEDEDAHLWLGTQHGIIRVSRRELDEVAAGSLPRVYPRVFGRAEGMQSEQCVEGYNSCLKTRAGLLCFTTVLGIAVIDPKQEHNESSPPLVRFEEFQMEGQPVELPAAATFKIPPGKERLEFHYTGLHFTAPEKVRFRYQLEGYDPDWVEAGARRIAYYTHLPPGDYRFRAAAHNGNGQWSETAASLALTILPHFWQTWWFMGLAGAGFVTGIAGIARYVEKRKVRDQMRRLELERTMERERTRIARDIHDDLGARLTRISILTEAMGREVPPDSTAAGQVRNIYDTARDLLRQLDATVWAVNPRNDRLDLMAEFILHYTQEFFHGTDIRCRLKMSEDLPPLPVAAEQRHDVFLAVKEALNNAVKHAGASEVQLQLDFSDGVFVVTVRDNGRGFAAAECVARGRGLENMRARAENLNGRLELQTDPGRGTAIRMEFNFTNGSRI